MTISSNISTPYYPVNEPEYIQSESTQTKSPRMSPSHSSITDHNELFVLEKIFEINKEYLRKKNFYSQTNEKRRIWFLDNYRGLEKLEIRRQYYELVNKNKTHVMFGELLNQQADNIRLFLQVTEELLDNLTSWDALREALLVGTASGAPKVQLKLHTSVFLIYYSSKFLDILY